MSEKKVLVTSTCIITLTLWGLATIPLYNRTILSSNEHTVLETLALDLRMEGSGLQSEILISSFLRLISCQEALKVQIIEGNHITSLSSLLLQYSSI